MGVIYTIHPLSTVPSCAIKKSQQHQEKFLRMQRIIAGAGWCEVNMLPLCYAAPKQEVLGEPVAHQGLLKKIVDQRLP